MTVLNTCIVRQLQRFHSAPKSTSSTSDANATGDHNDHVAEGIRRTAANEREMKKRDAKYSRASVFMVLLFVVCNAPRAIPSFMEIAMGVMAMPEVSRYSYQVEQVSTNAI